MPKACMHAWYAISMKCTWSYTPTFGACISGETPPPQYCSTGELVALILSAWFTALWSIHTMIFLLVSPLKETETGEPSASTATARSILLKCKYFPSTAYTIRWECARYYGIRGKPREQVAAKPRPATSSGATFASEHADFTAAQTACQISVDDCWA